MLGPFMLGEYKPGAFLVLRAQSELLEAATANGRKLPYLDSIRLDIQPNRELELLRFRRGELDMVNKLDPEMFDRLSSEMSHAVVDAGPSLDCELIFFNQVASAPLPGLQAELVPFRCFPPRHFGSDPSRRSGSYRL